MFLTTFPLAGEKQCLTHVLNAEHVKIVLEVQYYAVNWSLDFNDQDEQN